MRGNKWGLVFCKMGLKGEKVWKEMVASCGDLSNVGEKLEHVSVLRGKNKEIMT